MMCEFTALLYGETKHQLNTSYYVAYLLLCCISHISNRGSLWLSLICLRVPYELTTSTVCFETRRKRVLITNSDTLTLALPTSTRTLSHNCGKSEKC
jgi:hypothetical protein